MVGNPPPRNALLLPDLRLLIRGGEVEALRGFIEDQHPGRTAELIEDLESVDGDALFHILLTRDQAEVLSYLDTESQHRIVESMPLRDAADLLHLMSHDERADLVKRLDEDFVDGVLPHLAQAEREDIRRLTSYEPGTAGAVMTTDYVTLPAHITVRDALERLRQEAPDKETIYYSYVVDHNRRLIGFVSLRTLILSRRPAMIEDIMQQDIIYGRVDEDQESVARQIDKYDLIALPVVDTSHRLVGIITHDDAMDILRQEQTEDILKFGGVSPDPEADTAPYWSSTVQDVVRRRIKWLLMLFLAGELTIGVMEHFDWIKGRFPGLDDFLPLMLGTGGNAGSQTVGTVIRGMALGEIRGPGAWRVVLREWLTGLFLGLILGIVGILYVRYRKGRPWSMALVVGLTLLGICTWSNTIGSLVPLLARRAGVDPAVISAPFISTLVDATGLVIYFTTAMVLLIKWGS